MSKESIGTILLVASPQNSKDKTLPNIDLLDSRTFRGVVTKFDQTLGLGFAGSLHPDRQTASPVMSIAAHADFVTRLREELSPGYLFAKDDIFKVRVTGHSIGEMAAFVEAGIMDIETMAKVLHERERITTHPLDSGFRYMMAVVGIDIDNFVMPFQKISQFFGEGVRIVLANRNTPTQGVLSIQADEETGDMIAMKLPEILSDQKHPLANKLRVRDLKMQNAFHAPFLGAEEFLFKASLADMLNEHNFRKPARDMFYSPMLGDWVVTKKQAMDILCHQLTRQVDFRGAILELVRLPDLLAIVTADILDITPGLVQANLQDNRVPIFNIKNEETMIETVVRCAELFNEYRLFDSHR